MAATTHSRVKGLVTVALLKSHYDERRDHVEMFQPFLLDTICSLPSDNFTIEVLQREFRERHGLAIPATALAILLTRARKRGHVRREGGQYFRIPGSIPELRLRDKRIEIDREHNALAKALREYAAQKNRNIPRDEDALALLLAFLEENQIAFLLDDPSSFDFLPPAALPARDASIVARFITDICLRDPHLAKYLERMLEGFVLQNALLLRDIGSISGKFRDLTIFFDTRFIFSALGLAGPAARLSAVESLDLFKATHVRLAIFENTIAEVKRVLAAYERKLGSSEGIRSLYPGLLTTYFLSNHYAPSDIKQVVALLEGNIRDLGLSMRRFPRHDARFTYNEVSLAKQIAGPFDSSDPRVVHDVDCIAAILTLRAGDHTDAWDNARFAFATTTGLLVSNTVRWYKSDGGTGVPPIIHVVTLSNLAWLKRPVGAPLLKIHELVAMCSAALRPHRALWDGFIRHLRVLKDQGTLTSDEAVAIVADQLTQTLLLDLEEERPHDEDVDAHTLSEVVERVRAKGRADADKQIRAIEVAAAQQHEEISKDAAARVDAAQERAGKIEEEHRQLVLHLQGRVERASNFISSLTFIVMFVTGTGAGLARGLNPQNIWLKIVMWAAFGIVTLFGVWRATWGGTLVQLRSRLREMIRQRLTKWFIPAAGLD